MARAGSRRTLTVMVMHAVERRRALARALHEPRVARFASLHVSIATYRQQAAAMFARIIALEAAGNDNIGPLRRALLACSEQIEGIARLVGAPGPAVMPQEWIDIPTLPRRR